MRPPRHVLPPRPADATLEALLRVGEQLRPMLARVYEENVRIADRRRQGLEKGRT